jgi:hypothetical protein
MKLQYLLEGACFLDTRIRKPQIRWVGFGYAIESKLAGAFYGPQAIPFEWLDELERTDYMGNFADAL